MSQIKFLYRNMGQNLRTELSELIYQRKSSVILGMRHLGKSQFLRKFAKDLEQDPAIQVVSVQIPHKPIITEAFKVRQLVQASLPDQGDQATAAPTSTPPIYDATAAHKMLSALEDQIKQDRRQIVLFISNIDSLSIALGQALLVEIQTLANRAEHRLVAVITGEVDLHEFFSGPESTLNFADDFFLVQGFDQEEFTSLVKKRPELMESHITSAPEQMETITRALFDYTGGNLHYARGLLWAWSERFCNTEPTEYARNDLSFQTFIGSHDAISLMLEMGVFQDASRILRSDQSAWEDILRLNRGTTITMQDSETFRKVELAGIAVRDQGFLRYSSKITRQYATQHFDDRRLADMYAMAGNWPIAKQCYSAMDISMRVRPYGSTDRTQTMHVLDATAAQLHELATDRRRATLDRLQEVKCRFLQLTHFLFGVGRVERWHWNKSWTLTGNEDYGVSLEQMEFANLVTNATWSADDVFHESEPIVFDPRGQLLVALPSADPHLLEMLVLHRSCLQTVVYTAEQKDFLRKIGRHFRVAYEHILEVARIESRLKTRQNHLQVAVRMVSALARSLRTPRHVLEEAGKQLLCLGYQRVMFALVNSAKNRICMEVNCFAEGVDPTALQTDFPLCDPWIDIQPWVVWNQRPLAVADASDWTERRRDNERGIDLPAVNVRQCRDVGMRGFAVIPLLYYESSQDVSRDTPSVFGTVHVEPVSGRTPTSEELEDLMDFGKILTAVVIQSERVTAFMDMLDFSSDAILLLDNGQRVRYTNMKAARELGLTIGWQDPPLSLPELVTADRSRSDTPLRESNQQRRSQVDTTIRRAFEKHVRQIRYVTDRSKSAAVSAEEFTCELFPEWRQAALTQDGLSQSFNAMATVRDLTPIRRLLDALRLIAEQSEDMDAAANNILKQISSLQLPIHRPRIYRIDPNDPAVLVSFKSLDLVTNEQQFNSGYWRMTKTVDEDDYTWRCIDRKESVLIQWDSKSKKSTRTTLYGIDLEVIKKPKYRGDWKHEGDIWIEIPLFANDRMFGKLVVDCTRSPECSLSPEQLELLNLYCALSGALLDALDRKQKWVNRASEMAMAKIAHSIKTKFAALDGLWTEYSRAAPNNPSIEKLNSFLKPSVLTTSRYVSRIHELFGRDVKLEHTSFNLASFLQEKSREHSCEHREDHPGLTIRVVCAEDVQVQLDPLALGIVLGNMFENSRAMTDPGQVSYVLVTAAIIDDHLQILVVDNGPGIPHEYRDKIFDLLFSHRPDGRQSTGLGLSQVRQIMDAFRGAVAVLDAQHIPATFVGGQGLQEDALLQGAAFKLIFPHALRKDVEK